MKTTLLTGATLVAFFVLLGIVAVPQFVRSRQTSCNNTCIANLKQIDGAKEQWALEQKKEAGAMVTMADLVGTDKYIKNTPTCPDGGKYTINPVGTPPTCSIGASRTPAHVLPQ